MTDTPKNPQITAKRVDEGSLSPVLGQQADLSEGPKLFEAKELGRLPALMSIVGLPDP